MGLFGMWKRERSAERSADEKTNPAEMSPAQLQQKAEELLGRANASATTANHTTSPGLFFNAYEDTLQAMRQLVALEAYVPFSGRRPSEILAELEGTSKRDAAATSMVNRCLEQHRWSNRKQAETELAPYWAKLPKSARDRIAGLPDACADGTDPADFSPTAYDAANTRQIEAFRSAFDLTSVEGIRAITVDAVTPWVKSAPGVPSHPVEILSKQASAYARDHIDLAVECLRKANELRPHSGMLYSEESYLRLVRYLYKAERFAEGDQEYQRIHAMFHGPHSQLPSPHALGVAALNRGLDSAKADGVDLVEVTWSSTCCEICGKYRGRIFSISGQDARFPKFPSDFCVDCGLNVFPFREGVSVPLYSNPQHWIEENARPLVDTRTPSEKDAYLQWQQRRRMEHEHQLNQLRRERQDHMDYAWIRSNLPDLLPNTFSGYRRMKTRNTANFQKLRAAALALGYRL